MKNNQKKKEKNIIGKNDGGWDCKKKSIISDYININ
jgi:hypothetical protein